ncbi:unnamed protein product [Somion occarium]|uniref:F-box domain-containing protein n=1 Tax=Somion occarium TaxID=3059160 RepID=A0ABP1DVI0_9APHY
MMLRLLPLELLEIIVSFLHGSKTDLKACSLVHSSWLEISRKRLFSSIRWTVSLYECSNCSDRLLPALLGNGLDDNMPRLPISLLIIVVQKLPALRILRLDKIILPLDFFHDGAENLVLRSLRTLIMGGDVFLDLDVNHKTTLNTFTLFPALFELRFEDIIWVHSNEWRPNLDILPNLQKLAFSFGSSDNSPVPFLDMVAALVPSHGLREIYTEYVPAEGCQCVADILQRSRDSVKHLMLRVDEFEPWTPVKWMTIGQQLSQLTSLQTFSTVVTLCHWYLPEELDLSWDDPLSLISLIPISTKNVIVVLEHYKQFDVDPLPWHRIGSALQHVSSLRQLVLIVGEISVKEGDYYWEELSDAVGPRDLRRFVTLGRNTSDEDSMPMLITKKWC